MPLSTCCPRFETANSRTFWFRYGIVDVPLPVCPFPTWLCPPVVPIAEVCVPVLTFAAPVAAPVPAAGAVPEELPDPWDPEKNPRFDPNDEPPNADPPNAELPDELPLVPPPIDE